MPMGGRGSRRSKASTVILAAAGLSLLAGCGGGPPTRLYLLAPIGVEGVVHDPGGIAIGVGPVVIPQYLDRPEIVVRASAGRLQFADAAQWGGQLDNEITRVLAENLSDLLATAHVAIYPWNSRAAVGLQVTVEVVRFERDAGGAVTLSAFWSITDTVGGTVRVARRSTIVRTIDSSAKGAASYDATVDLMSDALAGLSQEIAAAIEPLSP